MKNKNYLFLLSIILLITSFSVSQAATGDFVLIKQLAQISKIDTIIIVSSLIIAIAMIITFVLLPKEKNKIDNQIKLSPTKAIVFGALSLSISFILSYVKLLPVFSDRRVREAITLAFDFEWMNKALFYNACDVLCGILSGGPYGPHLHDLYVMDEPQGVSHFLGAIDIAHFIEPAAFKSALSTMSREIKALKKADGVEGIFLPGERSGRKAEENAANGIELPQPVYEELLELGKPYGLSL